MSHISERWNSLSKVLRSFACTAPRSFLARSKGDTMSACASGCLSLLRRGMVTLEGADPTLPNLATLPGFVAFQPGNCAGASVLACSTALSCTCFAASADPVKPYGCDAAGRCCSASRLEHASAAATATATWRRGPACTRRMHRMLLRACHSTENLSLTNVTQSWTLGTQQQSQQARNPSLQGRAFAELASSGTC